MNEAVWCVAVSCMLACGVGCSGDDGPQSTLGGGGGGAVGGGGGGGGGDEVDAGPDVGEVFAEDSPEDTHDFLYRGLYNGWPQDQTVRMTEPHGVVKRFQNPVLNAALGNGAVLYPLGSAAVLEVYNANDDELMGWAAMVKVAENGDREDWYYYETFDTDPDGNFSQEGVAAPLCADCHQNAPFDYIY